MTKLIEDILKNSKNIAMVGVSSLKKKEDPKNLKKLAADKARFDERDPHALGADLAAKGFGE